MPSIFLSYSSADSEFVAKLALRLRESGIRVWYAEGQIKPGDSLVCKLKSAIDEVDYLGVVLSPDAADSDWVRREINWAYTQSLYSKGIRLIPLLLRDCLLPTPLKDVKYVDFRDPTAFETAIAELAAVVTESKHSAAHKSQRYADGSWSLQDVRAGFDFGVIAESDGTLHLSADFEVALHAVAEDRATNNLPQFLNDGFFDLTVRAILRTHPGGRIVEEDIEPLAKQLGPLVLAHTIDLAASYGLIESHADAIKIDSGVKDQFGEMLISKMKGESVPSKHRCVETLIELTRYSILARQSGSTQHAYLCAALLYYSMEDLGFFAALGV